MAIPCFTHQAAFYYSCGQCKYVKKSEIWPNHSGFPEVFEEAKMRSSSLEFIIIIFIIIIIVVFVVVVGSLRLCLVLLSTNDTGHWTKHLLRGYGGLF
jgi:type IV secretory pathway TrbL component